MPVVGPMEGAFVQQVLKVAILFPVLERRILLSFRKGAWDRVRKGLVPLSAGGTVPIRDFLEQPQTVVSTMAPTVMLEMFQEPPLKDVAEEVEKLMKEIIQEAI